MKFTFDPSFARYTNNLTEFEVEAEVFGQAVAKLFEVFPQLYVNLMDNDGKVARESYFILNDETPLHEFDDVKTPVSSNDVVHLSHELPTGAGAIGQIIAGVVMIIIGAVLCFVPGMQAVGAFMIKLGIGTIVGGIATAIIEQVFSPDSPNLPDGISSSSTYTFNGIQNTTASGIPVPIIYGEHRVGGHVLNLFTQPDAPTATVDGVLVEQTYLYAQVALGEGPIESVQDMFINGYPQYFYNAVTSYPDPNYVRYGEETQTVMPDFGIVENTSTLGLKILNTDQKITVGEQVFTEYFPISGLVDSNLVKLGPYTRITIDDTPPDTGGGG